MSKNRQAQKLKKLSQIINQVKQRYLKLMLHLKIKTNDKRLDLEAQDTTFMI
jgi:hypothetical protein